MDLLFLLDLLKRLNEVKQVMKLWTLWIWVDDELLKLSQGIKFF